MLSYGCRKDVVFMDCRLSPIAYRLSTIIYDRLPAKDSVAAAGWLDPTMMMREEILRDILTGLPGGI